MGEPLAVAILDARTEVPAGDPREPESEAAVPAPAGDRLGPGEVGRLGDARAEAGGAHQGAIGAGEAALGDLGPARAVRGGHEALRKAFRRDRVTDPLAGGGHGRVGGIDVGLAGRLQSKAVDEESARVGADADDEAVIELGQREVEVRSSTSGPVPMDVQKHVLAGATHSTAMTTEAARLAA